MGPWVLRVSQSLLEVRVRSGRVLGHNLTCLSETMKAMERERRGANWRRSARVPRRACAASVMSSFLIESTWDCALSCSPSL